MGFSITFNWVLQIEPPQALEKEGLYKFEKPGSRAFPLNAPIDLIDLDRNAIAKIRIKSFSNQGGVTTGEYSVLKIYVGQEKAVLTRYWIENV